MILYGNDTYYFELAEENYENRFGYTPEDDAAIADYADELADEDWEKTEKLIHRALDGKWFVTEGDIKNRFIRDAFTNVDSMFEYLGELRQKYDSIYKNDGQIEYYEHELVFNLDMTGTAIVHVYVLNNEGHTLFGSFDAFANYWMDDPGEGFNKYLEEVRL